MLFLGGIIINTRRLVTTLAIMATVPLSKIIYFLLNRPVTTAFVVETQLDHLIPLVPAFVIPYILWYPYLAVGMFYLAWRDQGGFLRMMVVAHLCLLFSYLVYFGYQSTMPRPELASQDVFSSLLGLIWAVDQPYNCLPSIHVLWCVLISLGVQLSPRVPNPQKLAFHFFSVVIILSTMFTKQHGILDALAALILAGSVYFLASQFRFAERLQAHWLLGRFFVAQ